MPPEPAVSTRPVIILSDYDARWAVSVGHYRFHESANQGRTQSDGSNDPNGLANHKRGAAGELALCRFLEIDWQAPVNTYNRFPDLDGYLECRSKPDRENYLRLYPRRDRDKGAALFVSVARLGNSQFRIEGWIMGARAMQGEFLRTNRYGKEEWQVPLFLLQPATTLRTELDRRLAVVDAGRDRMRVWVRDTMASKGLL